MSFVCVKPVNLSGNRYLPGEIIEEGHVLPNRVRALIRTGCIAKVTEAEQIPTAELVQVETGEEVKFTIHVIQDADGGTAQMMAVPLTEGEIQHVFSVMQMNVEEAAKAIEDIQSEDILIVLHAADSRQGVKKAARKRAMALTDNGQEPPEGQGDA